MAFFEDLGKKITDVSQATIQKAKDTTDTMKYSSAISDEEKSIRGNYAKLGEILFNEIKDHAEGEYAPIVEQINASRARIDELKSKIDEIKAAGKCPNCGAAISADDTFCAACGTKIEKKAAAGNVCPKCGKPLNADAAFCIYCGTKIETTDNNITEETVSDTTPISSEEVTEPAEKPDPETVEE